VKPALQAPAQHANYDAAGDVNSIKVGENSNIQDNVVVHVAMLKIEPCQPSLATM